MGELRTRINDYAVEEFKNYKGEEKLDHRDFVEMMNLSPEKSEKEQKEYVRNFVRDYTSGDPELRKKCLDDIYDRDDSLSIPPAGSVLPQGHGHRPQGAGRAYRQ